MKGICNKCQQEYVAGEEPDPCLGALPGIEEACCGHGVTGKAYAKFQDGTVLRGFKVEHHGAAKSKRNATDHGVRSVAGRDTGGGA